MCEDRVGCSLRYVDSRLFHELNSPEWAAVEAAVMFGPRF